MIDLGKYTGVVLSAYGATAFLLIALVVQTVVANTKARRALEAQDKNG
ncbi:heme exporter protein CcmD [Paracoccus sp. (in: a-proteobacteria)]|nr:heme exporter protein CcmD [Paracoccus sp. (in: a-proteobacteria)]